MCVNDMCGLNTEEERMEKVCETMKAYLSVRPEIPLPLPQHCSKSIIVLLGTKEINVKDNL